MSCSSIFTTSDASLERQTSNERTAAPGIPLTKDRVAGIFALLEPGCSGQFLEYLAEDVDWEVKGSHPLAGHYTSKESFVNDAYGRLPYALEQGSISFHVHQIVIDGNWAVVELKSSAKVKNGGWDYKNEYAWIMRWDPHRQVFVEVRAYLDSAMVARLVRDHPDIFDKHKNGERL